MKSSKKKKAVTILFSLLSLLPFAVLLSGCYTAEFHPAADYYNRRKNSVDQVTITYTYPRRPFVTLGTLLIRDFSGAIEDRNFRHFLRNEAKKRGAQGAWIKSTRLHREEMLTTRDASPGNRHGGPSTSPRTRRNVESTIATIKVVLFNYRDDPAGVD